MPRKPNKKNRRQRRRAAGMRDSAKSMQESAARMRGRNNQRTEDVLSRASAREAREGSKK